MAYPARKENEKKKAISFSLSNNDKELIKRVQEMYSLNTQAEAIMFCIKHAAAGRIAIAGQKIVSSLDTDSDKALKEKMIKPGESQATLGISAPVEGKKEEQAPVRNGRVPLTKAVTPE